VLLVVGILFIVASLGFFLDWLIRGKNYRRFLKRKGKTIAVTVNKNNTLS
jgi:hypothetical protein